MYEQNIGTNHNHILYMYMWGLVLNTFTHKAESQSFKPSRETKHGWNNQRVWDTGGKITVFKLGETIIGSIIGRLKKWGFERSEFQCF